MKITPNKTIATAAVVVALAAGLVGEAFAQGGGYQWTVAEPSRAAPAPQAGEAESASPDRIIAEHPNAMFRDRTPGAPPANAAPVADSGLEIIACHPNEIYRFRAAFDAPAG